ncbi:MAG: hypothetical protein J6W98_02775 [Bacteroidales bacterium]|nr:hypothetical protein [Bacteroidales bacterium]
MKIFRYFLLSGCLVLSSLTLSAQTGFESLLRENPERAAGVLHSYEYIPSAETPAPDGYKPFYVSHYGRHGSRRMNGDGTEPVFQLISLAHESEALTAEGEVLYEAISALHADHVGMVGQLTARGAREHRGIAQRLYDRVPAVWNDASRPEVHVQSSTYPRCLISMANFTDALDNNAPQLKYDFVSGEKYIDLLAHDVYQSDSLSNAANQLFTELALNSSIDTLRFIKNIFTKDPATTLGVDASTFIYLVWEAACIQQCTETPGTNILEHFFTMNEILDFYKSENAAIYTVLGNSIEFGDNVCWAARDLVQDFIDRADAALADGSATAADLRFGHDSGIMPLVCLMNLVGAGDRLHNADASDSWQSFRQVSMAANLQLVFYRKPGAEPLVKLYYNEAETLVHDLEPAQGPYYRWSDLKAFLEQRIAQYTF